MFLAVDATADWPCIFIRHAFQKQNFQNYFHEAIIVEILLSAAFVSKFHLKYAFMNRAGPFATVSRKGLVQ